MTAKFGNVDLRWLNFNRYFFFDPIANKKCQIANRISRVTGQKFTLSGQRSDLAPFDGKRTKITIPSEIKPLLGAVHKLRLQEDGGRWSKKSNFCKLLYHRKCKRRGVGGQKKSQIL